MSDHDHDTEPTRTDADAAPSAPVPRAVDLSGPALALPADADDLPLATLAPGASPSSPPEPGAKAARQKRPAREKKPRPERSPRPARTKAKGAPQPRPVPNAAPQPRTVPAATSFDLLGGAYRTARNTRMFNIVLVGLVAAAAVVLMGKAASDYLRARAETQTAATLQTERLATDRELDKATTINGVTKRQLEQNVRDRGGAIVAATKSETDVVKFLADLRASTPAGAEVTSVIISGSGPATPGAPAAPVTTTTAPGSKPAPPRPPSVTMTLVAKVSRYADIKPFQTALEGLPYLEAVTVTYTGGEGPGGITLTTTATISERLQSGRAATLAQRFNLPDAAPAPTGPKP